MISKTKRGFANATALIGGALNDAIGSGKLLFQDKGKNDLDVYLNQIDNENVEHMAFQGDFDELRDCTPSYEQLSSERIIDQINRNLAILKSLEAILEERLQAFSQFFNTLNKTRVSFEAFQLADGSIKHALDAFFVYEEQELQQARQQVCLGDLRKFITEIKVDVQKRHVDYQRSLSVADNEISSAEKRLLKAKEALDKYYTMKYKLEAEASVPPMKSSTPLSPKPARSSSVTNTPTFPSEERSERLKEIDELIAKQERETKEFARTLLQSIAEKDKISSATRRAYQQLNREVLESIDVTLQKIHARESESHGAKTLALEKLGIAVAELNTTRDEEEYISNYTSPDALVLSSQALSILGDIQLMDEQKRELENTSVATTATTTTSQESLTIDEIEEPVTDKTFTTSQALACLSEIFNYSSPVPVSSTPKELLEESFSSSSSSDNRSDKCLKAIRCLALGSSCLEGRKVFVSALNQFRSKKVNVGSGAAYLSAALWSLLDRCKQYNDVHNGKIIMMLSQTFYTVTMDDTTTSNAAPTRRESIGSDDTPVTRVYLKESLVHHPIWSEGWFWEQALWQCVLEQLQMLQYSTPWYEMSKEDRNDAILRVHDVIFSQVMAIAHSMVELRCSRSNVREFIYRMCCIHQLSEAQRHQLLQHTSRKEGTSV